MDFPPEPVSECLRAAIEFFSLFADIAVILVKQYEYTRSTTYSTHVRKRHHIDKIARLAHTQAHTHTTYARVLQSISLNDAMSFSSYTKSAILSVSISP